MCNTLQVCDADARAALGLTYEVLNARSAPDLVTRDTDIATLLRVLFEWFVQELYLDCPLRIFQAGQHFVRVAEYQDPTTNPTGADFARLLLGYFDDSLEVVQALTADFQDYAHLFRFPRIARANSDSVTVSLGLPRAPQSPGADLEAWMGVFLVNFYSDCAWGAYTTGFDNAMHELTNPKYVAGSYAASAQDDVVWSGSSTSGPATYLHGYTVRMKLSFMGSLYQLVSEATNTGDFTSRGILGVLTAAQFDQIRVDASVPYPANNIRTRADFCAAKDDCACTYFVVFRGSVESSEMPLTTPAHNLYVNRFQEPNCLCYVSRAVPIGQDSVLHPFGLCFDQNCLNAKVSMEGLDRDCSGQCDTARAEMSSANWQNNFVNAAAVNAAQVESTCAMSVTPIAATTDRWAPSPVLVGGAACFVLSAPVYMLFQSLSQGQYIFSAWHLVSIALTWAVAALGVYALAGKYKCDYGNPTAQNKQAECVDRLTGILPMSRSCCDTADPLFCQCDPSSWDQRVCRASLPTAFCKCQSNGACLPSSGNSSILRDAPDTTNKLNYQYVFALCAFYALCVPLVTLGIRPALVRWDLDVGWVSIVCHLVTYIGLFVLGVGLPLALSFWVYPEKTHTIDVASQSLVCSVESLP